MNDDLLAKYVRPIDQPEPDEPSLVRGDAPLSRIEIRDASGNARSFPYAALYFAAFNPSVGMRLIFGEVSVQLGGLNLRRLFDAVHCHAAKSILVLADDTTATDGETVVTSCSFQPWKTGDFPC